ncbi:MAG: sigma-70 family RNA polymerase sigma factor [Rhodothermia bacterium]|nr:sigma-70 family RNA polymerase sigma factor [Rhodothermia bacterium]NNE35090.1 sigma-70 family RNA polymerase sigma factor [Rhodothermales bacterium]
MSELSDQAIVRQVLAGDVSAFTHLVDRYQRVVYNAAFRITSNQQDAEDVTQTVFLKVYENLRLYNSKYRFYSWMYRIAINEALNQQAKRRKKTSADVETVAEPLAEDRTYEKIELEQQVQEAIYRLDPGDRALVVLKHFQGFSYDEIGFILDLPVRKVKSRLYTARQRLKEELIQAKVSG